MGQPQRSFSVFDGFRLKSRVIRLSASDFDDLALNCWLVNKDVKLTDVVFAVKAFVGMDMKPRIGVVPRTATTS